MSEQQTQREENADESGVVIVEQFSFRRKSRQDNNASSRNLSPAVQPELEDLKQPDDGENTNNEDDIGKKRSQKKIIRVPAEKVKQNIVRKISSIKKKPSDSMPKTPTDLEEMKTMVAPMQQPIPSDIADATKESHRDSTNEGLHKKTKEGESPRDQITELRAHSKHSDWSEDEEAGGLPRCVSRVSRVSRVVRQLFCCGAPHEPQEEDDTSPHCDYAMT